MKDPAGRIAIITWLLNPPLLDEDGDQVFDKKGNPLFDKPWITVEEARELLNFPTETA